MTTYRLKQLTDTELINKRDELEEYLKKVIDEINFRKKTNGESLNLFPISLDDIIGSNKAAEQPEIKTKKTPSKTVSSKTSSSKTSSKTISVKKQVDEADESNEIPVTATVNVIKNVLTEHGIPFKSSMKKDDLIQLVRDNHLVRKCNAEAKK